MPFLKDLRPGMRRAPQALARVMLSFADCGARFPAACLERYLFDAAAAP